MIKIKVKAAEPNVPFVFGLDVSTKTGIVVMTAGQVYYQNELYLPVATSSADKSKRLLQYFKMMQKELGLYVPKLVVIEGYSFAGKFNNHVQTELGAVARLACALAGYTFVEVAPTTLKSFVVGKGNAKKNEVMLHVFKKWNFEPRTDNIADAYALARIGLCLIGQVKALGYESKALANIGKSKKSLKETADT